MTTQIPAVFKEHPLFRYMTVPKLSVGRRRQALVRMRLVAESDPRMKAIVQRIDEALAAEQRVLVAQQQWRGLVGEVAMHGARAHELDRILDRAINALATTVEGILRAFAPDSAEAQWALAIREQIFPQGVRAITALPYVEQASAVDEILRQLAEPELAGAVVGLHLQLLVDRVAEVNAQYGKALTRRGELTYEDVKRADHEAWAALSLVVAAIVNEFPPGSAEDLAAANALFKPLEDQRAEAAEWRARRSAHNGSENPLFDEDAEASLVEDGGEGMLDEETEAVEGSAEDPGDEGSDAVSAD